MRMQAVRLFVKATTLFLAATAALPAAAQTCEDAFAAYKRGDYVAAVRAHRCRAEQGDAGAQALLGSMYHQGKGVSRNYIEAVKWYRRAAEQGDAFAQSRLGDMYRWGEGVARNYAEAVKWYRRAAEQGYAWGQDSLADMYYFGKGVPQDYAEAAKWYRRAAVQGLAVSQNSLGFMYDKGRGVPQDYAEAAKWYRRAAEQGYADAQNNLGVMYYNGQGVSQNFAEAAKWYRRAARQGDVYAQNNLGAIYDHGQGVPQDFTEAIKWYRRAAEQGNARAQANLANMYEWGRGVRRDFVRAHKWFNLAAARSPASEKSLRERAVHGRDRVARRLTTAQLHQAQRLARVWRPSKGKGLSPRTGGNDDKQTRVASVQRALARLGYDPGPADGAPGPKTRAAIRAFQAAAGLPVDGRLSDRLERAIKAAVRALETATASSGPARRSLKKVSTGSGFRVSARGHILTNEHVIRGCVEDRLPSAAIASSQKVTVTARDDGADLALLKGPAVAPFAAFRQGRGIRPAARVVVAGFPLRGILAAGVNISTGNVAALAGPGNDRRLMQITAPVQPGNSGGPVLDTAGNVVGVVVSKLNALKVARATGDIPQNVNFAVSAGTARAFLDAEGVAYATAPSDKARAPEDVAAAARKFTVLVECWK